jgi:hypothetical protein
VWNGYWGPSPGADFDALGLNGFASAVATSGVFDDLRIGYVPYTNFLGFIYYLTIDHIFIGSIISCFAWLISAIYLKRSFGLIGVARNVSNKAFFIYSLLPSSILFTSVTIREPFQLLFVNLAIYSIIKINVKNKIENWFFLIFSVVCMGSLHGALLAFGILLLAGFLVFPKGGFSEFKITIKLIVLLLISVFLTVYGFSNFGSIAYDLSGGLDNSIQDYQQSLLGVDARTHYKTDVNLSGFGDLLLFLPAGYIQYLFEPFPWRVGSFSDLMLLGENLLRFFLIWRAIKFLFFSGKNRFFILQLVFVSYLVMELIWSVGTINWGTSVRHHIPALGMLLLSAYAFQKNFKNERFGNGSRA